MGDDLITKDDSTVSGLSNTEGCGSVLAASDGGTVSDGVYVSDDGVAVSDDDGTVSDDGGTVSDDGVAVSDGGTVSELSFTVDLILTLRRLDSGLSSFTTID